MVRKTGTLDRDIAWLAREKYPSLFLSRNWRGDFRKLQKDAARLRAGEPLAYVIGWVPFLSTKILVDKRVLIPRPETEFWAEKAIAYAKSLKKRRLRVLDLCAGSGAIGISILKALPNSEVVFGEIDSGAIRVIRKNLAVNRIPARRAKVMRSDLMKKISGTFDLIVTNPPYIPSNRKLQRSVTAFEPGKALFGGRDGLLYIRRIISGAQKHLAPGGELWIEIDSSQARKINGFKMKFFVCPDQYGRPRYVRHQLAKI